MQSLEQQPAASRKRKQTVHSDELRACIVRWRDAGMSWSQIVALSGVPDRTVRHIVKTASEDGRTAKRRKGGAHHTVYGDDVRVCGVCTGARRCTPPVGPPRRSAAHARRSSIAQRHLANPRTQGIHDEEGGAHLRRSAKFNALNGAATSVQRCAQTRRFSSTNRPSPSASCAHADAVARANQQ
jgi:hypothetical protein